jgi:hypothetical protein
MQISNEALQNPRNRFLAVKGEATVGQAIGALQFQGGQPWWHLLVQMDDDSWGVTTFSNLYQKLAGTSDAAETRLGDWTGLIPADAVEQDSIETRAAETLAKRSVSRVLIVTDGGIPVGILVEGARRGSLAISAARLDELGGTPVNLKDYGSILLSSSKRAPDQQKPGPSGGANRS